MLFRCCSSCQEEQQANVRRCYHSPASACARNLRALGQTVDEHSAFFVPPISTLHTRKVNRLPFDARLQTAAKSFA